MFPSPRGLSSRFSRVPNSVNNNLKDNDDGTDPDGDAEMRSFWFAREHDEPFSGDLAADPKSDPTFRGSVAYANFMQAVGDVSMTSFADPNASFLQSSRHLKNVLPVILDEIPTWRQWLWQQRYVIATVIYVLVPALFFGLYAVPALDLNNSVLQCNVQDFSLFNASTSDGCDVVEGDEMQCLQEDITLNLVSDNLRVFAPLQGFAPVDVASTDPAKQFSCARSSCDPLSEAELAAIEADIDNIAANCAGFLNATSPARSIEELSDLELFGCSRVNKLVDCVFLQQSDSEFKRSFYVDDTSITSQSNVVSTPRTVDGKGIMVGIIVTLVPLPVLLLAAIYVCRRQKYVREKRIQLRQEELSQARLLPTSTSETTGRGRTSANRSKLGGAAGPKDPAEVQKRLNERLRKTLA